MADVEQRTDVRVRQLRNGARFAIEAIAELGIGRETLGQNLERHDAIEAGVARTVHFAHAAGAERCHDLVRTKPDAWRERHVRESAGLFSRLVPATGARRPKPTGTATVRRSRV
jgi:hypothetical protein